MAIATLPSSNAVVLSTTALVNHALELTESDDGTPRMVLRKEFAEYCDLSRVDPEASYGIVFSAGELSQRLSEYANENNLMFRSGLVRYTDEPMGMPEFQQACADGSIFFETMFTKRGNFFNQYEYRFVLTLRQEDILAGRTLQPNDGEFYVVEIDPIKCQRVQLFFGD